MPSAAKGAVLIMPEKKTSGIKNFFEEFKAFAMRGNVLDMAVGVVVGSAFTAIVNSLVNDIISPIIGLFFNADFCWHRRRCFPQRHHQFPHRGLRAVFDHQGHQYAAQEARGRAEGAHHQEMPLLPERDRYQGCPLPPLHFEARGLPRSKAVIFPVFSPALSALWTPPGLFCALFSGRRKENQNFFKKSIAFSGESWYYTRVVTTQQNMDG